jgi:hypothetical protein
MDDQRNSKDFQRLIDRSYAALRQGDSMLARDLAFSASRLNAGDERPWLILAAVAAPAASIYYLNHALELNPQSEAAQKGLAWASDRLHQPAQSEIGAFENTAKSTLIRTEKTPEGDAVVDEGGISPVHRFSAFSRIAKYTLVRGVALFASVLVSIFLIISIANLGGYMDTIQKALINEDINGMLMAG